MGKSRTEQQELDVYMTIMGSEDEFTRITLAQLEPTLGDVEANQDAVESAITQAKSQGSDLIVFPELFLTGYHIGDNADRLTRKATEAVKEIQSLTEDLVVILGTPWFGDSGIYNSAVVLEDSSLKGVYHKTHLYGIEPEVFVEGDDFPTFETAVGTLGIEICYDMEFPEVARQLTLNGADILITILANMRPCIRDQELYHGARGLENGCPHILCNRVGEEQGVDFFGNSGIVNHRGRDIISLGKDFSEISSASIQTNPDRSNTHDYLGDRRPPIYDLEIRK